MERDSLCKYQTTLLAHYAIVFLTVVHPLILTNGDVEQGRGALHVVGVNLVLVGVLHTLEVGVVVGSNRIAILLKLRHTLLPLVVEEEIFAQWLLYVDHKLLSLLCSRS